MRTRGLRHGLRVMSVMGHGGLNYLQLGAVGPCVVRMTTTKSHTNAHIRSMTVVLSFAR